MATEWRTIPGHPYYQASSAGEIRRALDAPACGTHPGKVRQPALSVYGYLRLQLSHDMVKTSCSVHKLVARAFIGECPKGMQIHHRDGNKVNNRPGNLEYVTPKQNIAHSFANGTQPLGKDRGAGYLENEQVLEIRSVARRGELTVSEMSRRFGVSRSTVRRIRDEVTHKWLQEDSSQQGTDQEEHSGQ